MSATFALALDAAHAAAASQHYPLGALYVVATPIGNLADISLRALHVLKLADCIACEDTRHTQSLLRAYGVEKAAHQLLALHQHNEAQTAQMVIERLRLGLRIAYVSDAGTPAISDPGARLVGAVRGACLLALALPGASSVTAALSVAGIATDQADSGQFVFAGFLSSKATVRAGEIAGLAREHRAVVLLEAPHRIEALAGALAELGDRPVTISRELTKQFEETATVPSNAMTAWLQEQPNRTRGEFVVVLHPVSVPVDATSEQRVLALLLAELPLKTAVKLTAEITGASRNTLYDAALALRKQTQ